MIQTLLTLLAQVRFLLFLGIVASLLACTPKMPVPELSTQPLVWPATPQEPRIEWVKEVKLFDQQAQESGLWAKVKNFLFGYEPVSMLRPYGVATDYSNRLFVADTGASIVHVFDLVSSRHVMIEGAETVPLQAPIALAYAGNDQLYITDSAQGMVLRYNLKEGVLTPFIPYSLQRPTGIAYNWQTKQLFVSDTAAHEIVVFDLSGAELFRFGGRGTEEGLFNYPTDIWVDLQGQVYVTDALNARIQIFSAEGRYIRSFGQPGDTPGSFAKPKGVTVDRAGHIYVCDALFDAVQIFDAEGHLLMTFGDNGSRPGQFWMPSGIFADRQGFIYVTDTYNRRIQVFRHINCTMKDDCSK